MTPRQQEALLRWLPLAFLFGSGLIAATSLRRDVDDSVRVPRYREESLRVNRQLDDLQRAVIELQAQRPLLQDICRAVRCAPR